MDHGGDSMYLVTTPLLVPNNQVSCLLGNGGNIIGSNPCPAYGSAPCGLGHLMRLCR